MSLNVDIGRLQINLHGISSNLVEEAIEGLDAELRRRLGVRNLEQGLNSQTARINIAELALSTIHLDSTLNVSGLRGLIADRLLDAIETQQLSQTTVEGEI